MSPPTYPARPINGGPLPLLVPKIGQWFVEPKYNGWRALLHLPTGTMFNRHGKRLTIEAEFASAIHVLQDCYDDIEWLDCEALERRHGIGRGTLIVFDYIPAFIASSYRIRSETLASARASLPVLTPFEKPDPHFAYLAPSWDSSNAPSLWNDLQSINKQWNTTGLNEFYEGVVMKRADSPYPIQLRSPDTETHFWTKHRWTPSK